MGSCSFHPDGNHSSFHPGRNSIRLPPLSTRMYHIWHSVAAAIPSGCITSGILLPPSFHPDVLHPVFCYRRHSIRMSHIWNSTVAAIPSGCLTFGILTSDGRGEHFNFPGQTYPDPLIALTPEEFRSQFCTVPRCSPEASRYVRPTSLDIFL